MRTLQKAPAVKSLNPSPSVPRSPTANGVYCPSLSTTVYVPAANEGSVMVMSPHWGEPPIVGAPASPCSAGGDCCEDRTAGTAPAWRIPMTSSPVLDRHGPEPGPPGADGPVFV